MLCTSFQECRHKEEEEEEEKEEEKDFLPHVDASFEASCIALRTMYMSAYAHKHIKILYDDPNQD